MAEVELEGPIEGAPFLMLGAFDLGASGYVGEEWLVSGSACGYALTGEAGDDGRWDAEPRGRADWKTRIVVRRPRDPERWNGTVAVEWLNVSGGIDAAPDWLFLHRHWMREGAAWVGVSVQKAGIDGGGLVTVMPLKQADAGRYGGLVHPGDAFAFDIYTQIGRMLRDPSAGPLGGLAAERVVAIGESQSAGFLVTYVNAVDPLARCFDGFLVHGRPGNGARVDGTYLRASENGDVSQVSRTILEAGVGHRIREDARVPVLTLQSETDVVRLFSGRARQPDSERFRLWEIAGASHFDTYGLIASQVDDGSLPIEELARRLAPTDAPMGMKAAAPVNSGPQQHYVANAAFASLERWIRGGAPPAEAPRLALSAPDADDLERDALGIARGGIRTPWVDAPSAALSGLGQRGEGFLFLFGTTRPLADGALAELYPGGADEHRDRFHAATDAAVAAGFLLEADADEIRALGTHGRQPSGWRG